MTNMTAAVTPNRPITVIATRGHPASRSAWRRLSSS
jgi:hypothetical protein